MSRDLSQSLIPRWTAVLLLTISLSGCKVAETASFFFTKSKSGGGDNTPESFKKFERVIQTGNCTFCHANPQSDASQWFSASVQSPSYQDWIGLAYKSSSPIVAGKASESRLHQRMKIRNKDNDQNMPPGWVLSESDIQAVETWINSLPADNGGGDDPGAPPPPDGDDGYGNGPAKSVTRVMDRKGMHQWFLSRFGETVSPFSKASILGRPLRFGGGCAQKFAQTQGSQEYCEFTLMPEGIQTDVPRVPEEDLGREAFRTRTCRDALFKDGSELRLYHALRSLPEFQGKPDAEIQSSLSSQSIPTAEQLRRMYKVFYGFRQPSDAIVTHLGELAEAASGDSLTVPNTNIFIDRRHEPWRYVLLALCYGADTQFL